MFNRAFKTFVEAFRIAKENARVRRRERAELIDHSALIDELRKKLPKKQDRALDSGPAGSE